MIMNNSILKFGKLSTLTVATLSVLALNACATQNQSVMDDGVVISDPLEDTNRAVFKFNEVVDDNIIHPAIKGYRFVVPKEVRNSLGNFLRNLRSPVIFANQVLQGDIEGAGNVLLRTAINTFTGFGGLFDFAAKEGMPHESEDFGQTLATWGLDNGPYLVVPLLGPSTARDSVGYIVDAYADPLRWYLFDSGQEHLSYQRTGLNYLNVRDNLMDVLEDLRRSSIDYYASTRSIYYQRRDALIRDENPDDAVAVSIPDYDE
ncbi:MAG: VacJ family lipoprotein [Alphaproteobacteria bacterium]|nr:VacJ family lipoprotein [Alphaproteobacteria bacterium]